MTEAGHGADEFAAHIERFDREEARRTADTAEEERQRVLTQFLWRGGGG
ncbi:hypothetical protein [Streptomyces sp. NPDC060243]